MPDRSPAAVADSAAQRYVALAVRSRRRILDVLRAAGHPVPLAELAAELGLHVTTARAHLRVLEGAGLVVRSPHVPNGRGRPRYLYAAATEDVSDEGHRQLAGLLAGALGADTEQGRQLAVAAGRRWAEQQVPAADVSWEAAVDGIGRVFDRLGFGPRRVDDGGAGRRFALDHCPFRDVARAHPEIVCAVHLGLMRGALARAGQAEAAGAAVLSPFVGPELCMAEVPRP